jgi:hypothetical protein
MQSALSRLTGRRSRLRGDTGFRLRDQRQPGSRATSKPKRPTINGVVRLICPFDSLRERDALCYSLPIKNGGSMEITIIRGLALAFLAISLAACADSNRPGADGGPQAAGAEDLRQAVRAYSKSAPVRRASQYAGAVGQGLIDPMMEDAKRRAAIAQASVHHMSPARPLADDERCVGSSIVRVSTVDKVAIYTQVLQAGRPIYCTGALY